MSHEYESLANPVSRRAALASIGAFGTGSVGTGLLSGTAGAATIGDQEAPFQDAPAPVSVERKLATGTGSQLLRDFYPICDASLVYYGTRWDGEPPTARWSGNWGDGGVWRSHFMLVASGTNVVDHTIQGVSTTGLWTQDLGIEVDSGEARIDSPVQREMLGYADSAEFADELSRQVDSTDDLAQDLKQMHGRISDGDYDAGDADFHLTLNNLSNQVEEQYGVDTGFADPGALLAFGIDAFLPVPVFTALYLTYNAVTGVSAQTETVDPTDQAFDPPDAISDPTSSGFASMHYVAFDVVHDPDYTPAGSVSVSTSFGAREGKATAEFDVELETMDTPESRTCNTQNITEELWQKGYNASAAGSDAPHAVLSEASPPEPTVDDPEPYGVYSADDSVAFDADRDDAITTHWYVRDLDAEECWALTESELDGYDDMDPGLWEATLHQRNESGLSSVETFPVGVSSDGRGALVPTGEPHGQEAPLDVPVGVDEYLEVDA